jgi:hypothetical protein
MAALRLFALMKVSMVDISTFKFGIGSEGDSAVVANLNGSSTTENSSVAVACDCRSRLTLSELSDRKRERRLDTVVRFPTISSQ